MTNYEKYEYWHILSKYDLDTAQIMLDNQRYCYVPVLCQQAIERMIKGMTICHTGREAVKSHNIPFLANKLAQNPAFLATDEGKRFASEKTDHDEFMVDLMFYYMSDYPFSYKRFHERFTDKDVSEKLYENSQALFNWLEGFQRN